MEPTYYRMFSVAAHDCRWEYFRGSGAGGQHRNKTSSAVRCTHEPSGAVGEAEDSRSQHDNKVLAFGRMARSDKFRIWLKVDAARRFGYDAAARDAVEKAMTPHLLRIEVKDESGRWTINASAFQDD